MSLCFCTIVDRGRVLGRNTTLKVGHARCGYHGLRDTDQDCARRVGRCGGDRTYKRLFRKFKKNWWSKNMELAVLCSRTLRTLRLPGGLIKPVCQCVLADAFP